MSTHRRGWQSRAWHPSLIMLALLACSDSPQSPVDSDPAPDTQAPIITASLANTRLTSPGAVLVTVKSNEQLSRVEVGRDDGKGYYADAEMLDKMRDASADGFTYKFLQEAADGGNGTRSFVVRGLDLTTNVGRANAGSVVIDNRWETLRSLDAVGRVYLGTDGSGNFVTAAEHSSRDVMIVKVDAAGKELWTRTFGGPDWETLWSLGVSASGQIVIAGMVVTGNGAPGRCFVASFAADGTPGAVARLDDKLCVAAAVDAAGNVFVAGVTQSAAPPTSCDFLVKLSSEGTPIWSRAFGSAGSGSGCDDVSSIAVDAQGHVYVGGYTRSGGTFDGAPARGLKDGFVIKFDAAGSQLWARQHGFAGLLVLSSHTQMSLDPDGGIVIPASVFDPISEYDDALVVRYDASGALLWSRRFLNRTEDIALGVAADRRGVYVVGYVTPGDVSGDFKEQRQGRDGYLAFLSPSGEVQSVRLLGDGGPRGLYGVALAKSGDVVAYGGLGGHVLVRHPVVP
jgi:outer membrane protein assembly factor BamB